MRIAFLDQYSEPGGAQLCLAEILAATAQRGWEADLWAPGDGALHKAARQFGMEAHSLPLNYYTNSKKSFADFGRYAVDILRSRKRFQSAIQRRPVDLIYVNGPRVLPLVAGLGQPVIFHSHSVLDKRYSQWVARRSLHGTQSTMLASSEYLASRLRQMLPQAVRVTYNGVPDLALSYARGQAASLSVGIVGRIAPEKGHLDFLEAVRRLAGCGLFRFSVIGEGMFSNATYEAEVRRIGASLDVTFTGWKDPAELYCDLDLLVVPSAAHDANPRVLMEAMSAGVCAIAYRSGGIVEIVTDGYDGVLTDRSPQALASAIVRLAEDAPLRHRLRVNARKTYEARFTVQRFRREVCDAIAAAGKESSEARFARRAQSPANDESSAALGTRP